MGKWIALKVSIYTICPMIFIALMSVLASAESASSTYEKLTDPLYIWAALFIVIIGVTGYSLSKNISHYEDTQKDLINRFAKMERKQTKTCMAFTRIATHCEAAHRWEVGFDATEDD